MDRELFKEKLLSLVNKFEKNKHHYLSKGYLEAQVRLDFIDPFFEALGWDMCNTKGLSHFEREVLLEKGETTGRPDYNFRVSGTTKFFVEAKAPSVALDDVNHIFQAKTYAYSTKEVYFAILTDFEEFKLFDASLRPDIRHAKEGLLFDFKYTDYLENIEKLWLLSKEEVEKGSLERLLPRDIKSKRLRVPVDRAFLEEMTGWREALAKDIYKKNPGLDVKVLNDIVQRLLDRLIFIRIAEDRKIREPRELQDIVEQWKEEGRRKPILSHLKDLFYEVNEDLNGDIFKPHACERVDVDSALVAGIIENLYFPKCRYRFEALGVELLGSIYERYLGNSIRVTPKRVTVEEKPEVRKAGGVYYTPKYIVDYIVKNTVGRLIEGKTPKEIAEIKILDPACGSGSFLLGAYQCLLDYHLKYYREHPKEALKLKSMPLLYYKQLPDEITLPIQEKARILRNNIYGVDIDPQAVEITMMSLYLKALEGEKSLLPKKQHLLPSLGYNIKCGNSLIGYDVLEQGDLFADDVRSRINPFDWNSKTTGFGEIMERGGFDAVVGNPPYIRIQAMKEWAPVEVEEYKRKYKAASKGNYDIYTVFIEKGLSLLNEKGLLGFILPHKFFQAQYGEPLRQIISEGNYLSSIVDFGDKQVFDGASTYTCLLFLNKKGNKKFDYTEVKDMEAWQESAKIGVYDGSEIIERGEIPASYVTLDPWNFVVGKGAGLFEKLSKISIKLGDVAEIFVGLQTSADPIFLFKKYRAKNKNLKIVFSKALNKEILLEADLLKKVIRSGDIERYNAESKALVLFPYKIDDKERVNILNSKALENEYPLTWEYLKENKKVLEEREHGKFKGICWYQLYPKNLNCWEQPKLMIPYMTTRLSAYVDLNESFYFVNVTTGGFGIKIRENIDLNYLASLLNSKLLDFYLKHITTNFRGGYFAANKQFIERLPIHVIDFKNPSEKAVHDRLVSLVDRMLELNKKKNTLPPSAEREKVEREITVTDENIDELVYGLYGITGEEKKIIEENL